MADVDLVYLATIQYSVFSESWRYLSDTTVGLFTLLE